MERGIRQRGQKERQSNGLRERERMSVGEKWFLRGLKMSVERNRIPEYF